MPVFVNPTLVRTCPPNLKHWYVVAASAEVDHHPLPIVLWHHAIVLYRTPQGTVVALEDRCPHRQVKLSEGKVVGSDLECAYHGWCFDPQGHCVVVPYLKGGKLPPCEVRSYPVREQDGFIWLYPGTKDSQACSPLGLPQWHHLNYIASFASFHCPGHFSFLIENLMDMYHGHLHDQYQAWASAELQHLQVEVDRITAIYQAQSYYKIDKIWSVAQLFLPALRRLHPEPLTVTYEYPHWVASLGADFKICCLFCPVSATETKAYLVHFTSLEAFPNLHKSPLALRRFLKHSLTGSAIPLLRGLIEQDIVMIAQEQQAFLSAPQQASYEVNPAIAQVQKFILLQAQNQKEEG